MKRAIETVAAWVRASAWAPLVLRSLGTVAAVLALAWVGAMPLASARVQLPARPEPSATPVTTPSAVLPAPSPAPVAPKAEVATDKLVALNSATAEQLQTLPGVGPKRAEAILALRQRIGHFRRVEDLLRVKGIGMASLRRLKPLVVVDAPVPSGEAKPAP